MQLDIREQLHFYCNKPSAMGLIVYGLSTLNLNPSCKNSKLQLVSQPKQQYGAC